MALVSGHGRRERARDRKSLEHPDARRAARPSTYVDALRTGIDQATAGFTPDLVLISAGFDSLAGDPLGGFTLEMEHVATLTRELVERADAWCGGRVVSALEGGYAPERLGEACMVHLEQLG